MALHPSTKRWRERKKAAGLCIMCGKNSQKPTSTLCFRCTQACVENRKKRAEKRKDRCSHCLNRKPAPGYKLCMPCRIKRRPKNDEERLQKRLRNHPGVTTDDYKARLSAQNNKCAICNGPPNGKWKQLDIDHDHKTGKFRGLLCHECNKGLGCFRDNKTSLRNAVVYLRKAS